MCCAFSDCSGRGCFDSVQFVLSMRIYLRDRSCDTSILFTVHRSPLLVSIGDRCRDDLVSEEFAFMLKQGKTGRVLIAVRTVFLRV